MKNKTHAARPCAHICARRLPLCIAITAALAAGFVPQAGAATTTTTVPAGTVVTKTADYFLGLHPADNDTLNVLGAGTQWNNTENLYVGSRGTGTLKVRDSGKVTAKTLAIGVRGTVNLDGGTLQVASGTIATGGVFNWTQGTLVFTGNANSDADGNKGLLSGFTNLDSGKTLTFAGAGAQWNSSGLIIGKHGTGALNILDSAQVSASTLEISSQGRVNLDGGELQVGTGTLQRGGVFNWNKGTLGLTGGASLGTGLLAANTTLDAGKTLRVSDLTDFAGRTTSGTLTIGSGKRLTLDGGTLDVTTGSVQSGGVFNWIKGTLGLKGEASLGSGLLATNITLDAGKTLRVSDLTDSAGHTTSGTLTIASGKHLTLDGGTLDISKVSVPSRGSVFTWIKGALGYTGNAMIGDGLLANTTTLDAGKTLRVDKNLSFNRGSSLTLDGGALIVHSSELYPNNSFKWIKGTLGYSEDATSGNGLLISADARNIGTGKTLVVVGTLSEVKDGGLTLDGGTIQTGNWSVGLESRWINGTVALTGDYVLGASSERPRNRVDPLTNLTTGKTLTVAKELTIASDAKLTLDGGTLQVASGILLKRQNNRESDGVFNWIKGTLSYTGDASIGSGLLASTTTVGFGKTLNVNGNLTYNNGTLNILDSGKVTAQTLAIGTKGTLNLGQGAQLSTVNGTVNNNAVTFNGNSTIQGNFTNNGSVVGSAGTLSFLNDVNGAGSYTANIAFKAAFNPGNSPAAVSFNGGNATFDSASVLNMEFLGSAPGAQYDQLVSINTLTFNGTLNLVFGNGYVPLAGSSFALFGFNNFSGSFGTAADGYSKITVAGYDRSKLDFSHLATDGSINVTAVPEPTTYAMLLAGLALIGASVRRRRAMAH